MGRITANVQSTGTVTVAPPFTVQIASGIDYQLHRFEPKSKFAALDSARIPIANDVFRLIVDETTTTDYHSTEYTIPDSIKRGPALVYVEEPLSPVTSWNFIPNPQSDDVMALWSASNVTLSDYPSTEQDTKVPKTGTTCVKAQVAASTTGTLTLTAANMVNDITVAKAAGRVMTYAAWIYSKSTSLTLSILDDSGTLATSSAHQGLGWELLSVEATVTQSNATTLSVRISDTGAGAITFFINDQWFYFGSYTKINTQYYSTVPIRIRKDDTRKRFSIPERLPHGRQLRLVGKDLLSALGTTLTTQVTNTMEVDDTTAELLYAKAAEILFEQERISAQNMPQVAQRIGYVKSRTPELRMNWDMEMPMQRVTSPYWR